MAVRRDNSGYPHLQKAYRSISRDTVMLYEGAFPPEDEVDFVADRPFLFVITDNDNLPLFAGVVNQPIE